LFLVDARGSLPFEGLNGLSGPVEGMARQTIDKNKPRH